MSVVLKVIGGLVLTFMALILYGMLTATPESTIGHDAERAVQAVLRDPSSAEFRHVYTYKKTDGSLTVCGEVNSRNGFGAMSGFGRFVYLANGLAIVESPGIKDGFEDMWIQNDCVLGRGGAIAMID